MNHFNIQSLTNEQKETRKKLLEISHQENLSHLGSCLSSIDIIDEVYKIKKRDEKFILSNGHAGIALYVILEKNGFIKNKDIKTLYVHPDRNSKFGIDVSTGSLGQGLPIALGLAISDKNKNVYCLISDGECAEGSIWETLRIAKETKTHNLKIIVNYNGWGGYGKTSPSLIEKFSGFGYEVKKIDGHNLKSIDKALKSNTQDKPSIIFGITCSDQFSFLKGLDSHYYVMTDKNYHEALRLLK